ncbi:CLUMA_CG020624, isoform A [Clunio marinus]|uniref:CLUMA_CG020624, isoform A n=1 Tax=Clunio marinus TaxID=568069 RepID=A0A1J1J9H6_9DIPT|nr:CLUMA_CG020624, isoform A [Clunio marinus]
MILPLLSKGIKLLVKTLVQQLRVLPVKIAFNLNKMISDETFPIHLNDDNSYDDRNTFTDAFDLSNFSSDFCVSNATNLSSNPSSSQCGHPEFSFASTEKSKKKIILPPPEKIKTKKSISCHDLQLPKKKYDHVESKVKKIIQSMKDDDKRRKLSRHKSMPIANIPSSTDTTHHHVMKENYDDSDLIMELEKKNIKILELEESCHEKEERIYSLEMDRARMKMVFDELRLEMQELKEREKSYNQQQTLSSSRKFLINGPLKSYRSQEIASESQLVHHFTNKCDISAISNQTDFIDPNNASSDNLIPLPETSVEDVSVDITPDITENQDKRGSSNEENSESEPKKTKKFRRFFKLVSCVSK